MIGVLLREEVIRDHQGPMAGRDQPGHERLDQRGFAGSYRPADPNANRSLAIHCLPHQRYINAIDAAGQDTYAYLNS
jgi:hypothetical protein